MENAVFKYSDFFQDDGGFEKAKSDLKNFGKDIIKEAESIKAQVKFFDMEDTEGLQQLEKQTEAITKTFKKYEQARVDITKIEKEYQKTIRQTNASQDQQINDLAKLDKSLQTQRKNLKELNALGTINEQVIDDVNKARVEAQLNIKNIKTQIKAKQKEILKSNELSKQEQKLLKAKLVLDKQQISTLTELSLIHI